MKQGFFFDGVAVPGNNFSINQTEKGPCLVFPYAAKAPFTLFNDTEMITESALDFIVAQFFIQESLFHGLLLFQLLFPVKVLWVRLFKCFYLHERLTRRFEPDFQGNFVGFIMVHKGR